MGRGTGAKLNDGMKHRVHKTTWLEIVLNKQDLEQYLVKKKKNYLFTYLEYLGDIIHKKPTPRFRGVGEKQP